MEILQTSTTIYRIMIFIDFWNFQLSIRNHFKKEINTDWENIPTKIYECTWEKINSKLPGTYSLEGTRIYASYRPITADNKLKNWLEINLRCFSGIYVDIKQQKGRKYLNCSSCKKYIEKCPHCGIELINFQEKGIDVAIATDLIRFAWENAYDIAILVSSDADFISAVKFLSNKGKKIIHAGFYPTGSNLKGECWASINLCEIAESLLIN